MSVLTETLVTVCEPCNTYVWQDSFDLDEPIRDGFADVEDVLYSERDIDTYGWPVHCGICDARIGADDTKYLTSVVFRK